MSETGAVEACPLVELTPLVDVPLVWMERNIMTHQFWFFFCGQYNLDTTPIQNTPVYLDLVQLTFELEEVSPFCTEDPGNAEEVEPPS